MENELIGFFCKDRENRIWWIAGLGFFLLEFTVFKMYYPYANYTGDSYYYLEAATTNADVSTWPVAYSKFLRLISVFSHSDTVLVGIQLGFLKVCELLFLFVLFQFIKTG